MNTIQYNWSKEEMQKVVFFNIAWMRNYQGVTTADVPQRGGKYIGEMGFGAEVFNFQPFNSTMLGFVEAGWNDGKKLCKININNFGAHPKDTKVSGVLIAWVARHEALPNTVVVGWYKNATIYRERQTAPVGSNRKLPMARMLFILQWLTKIIAALFHLPNVISSFRELNQAIQIYPVRKESDRRIFGMLTPSSENQ